MPLQLQLWRGPDHHLPALPTPVTPSEQSARQSLLQQAAALMSPADPGPVPAQGLREGPVSSRGRRAPAPGPACLDPLTSSPFRPTPLSLATRAQVERATHGTPGSSTHGHAVQGLRASLSPAPEAWLRSVLPLWRGTCGTHCRCADGTRARAYRWERSCNSRACALASAARPVRQCVPAQAGIVVAGRGGWGEGEAGGD